MRIMIVDDEPFYIDHLKEVIENSHFSKSEQTQIVAQCISASQALEAIPTLQPDLIFTDIKMQHMNGIQLATTIRQKWPQIIVVIVSGYSSFEYARDAIRANVDDYLVKPVDPSVIEQLLNKTSKRIDMESYQRQQSLLNELLDSKHIEVEALATLKQSFTFTSYHVFYFNKTTSLLNKDHSPTPTEHEIQRELAQHPLLLKNERAWILSRNDSKNRVIVLGLYNSDDEKIKNFAAAFLQIIGYNGSNHSMAVSSIFKEITQLHQVAHHLHDELYQQLVIGHTKKIFLFEAQPAFEKSSLLLDSTDEKKIVIAVDKKDWKLLKKVITHWFDQWERNSCPNLYLQKNCKQIVQWLEKYFRTLDPLTSITTEKEIEEIIDSAYSYEKAVEDIWSLLSHIFRIEEHESISNKGKLLIEQITDYMAANLSEVISMTHIMDRFQISSTHLGTLFRKHLSKTFVEYLTTLRIDKAKELMRIYPDMPFKEISEIAGYTDRHYFTKVFKLVTGKSPTDFKEQLLQEEKSES
ncbi:response regulator [Cohnella sp. WQ 127256]|uniref:response regulator n=1 Tax=Cohnella sp. WQ 127256 TaxID=2938790 RepID=UPI0021199F13|nr:response regulator [Cohnella sp. WQ 127256]